MLHSLKQAMTLSSLCPQLHDGKYDRTHELKHERTHELKHDKTHELKNDITANMTWHMT